MNDATLEKTLIGRRFRLNVTSENYNQDVLPKGTEIAVESDTHCGDREYITYKILGPWLNRGGVLSRWRLLESGDFVAL